MPNKNSWDAFSKGSNNPLASYRIKPINRPLIEARFKGQIGIEFECEGRNFGEIPGAVAGARWLQHEDGSLRGESREYVLSQPIDYEHVDEAIDLLWAGFRENETRLNDSNNTSVHIHLNMDGIKINQLCSLICLYGTVEDVLVNWCGPYRVGNLFALRLSDCPVSVERIITMFRTGNITSGFGNDRRYLAMNLAALGKFGSLEFRSMRGTTDPAVLKRWVEILWRLHDAAMRIKNPEEIVREFSTHGAVGWLDFLFGPDIARDLEEATQHEGEDVSKLLWDGLRRVQPIIYSLPWEFIIKKIKDVYIKNPFQKPDLEAAINQNRRGGRVRGVGFNEFAFAVEGDRIDMNDAGVDEGEM